MNADKLWLRGLPPGGARVERLELGFANLPAGLRGARALFAADVHAGFTFPEEAEERLIDQIAGLAPDLILWGGDFAENPARAGRLFPKIARLNPRLGMAAVVGNNDRRAFRASLEPLRRLSERAGVRLLVNERWTRDVSGGRLTIAGLDEDYYGAPDASILNAPRGAGEMVILLSHSPAPLERLLDGTGGTPAGPETPPSGLLDGSRNLPDLILCGHTHGGQVRLFGRTLYDFRFDRVRPGGQRFFITRGVRREGDAVLVVSGGLGSSRLPLRINCPPELQLLTLGNDG